MRSIEELSPDELSELREVYYHQHLDDGSLEEIFGVSIDSAEDIPMDIIIVYYHDTLFCKEDFFCNM